MGKFRFIFTISLTVLHVVAFIVLLVLLNLGGLEWSGVYFGISFLAIVVVVFASAGIIIWQWKANGTEQRSFPVLLPHFTVVMVYDLAVLALILVGWLLHPAIYISLQAISFIVFVFMFIVVGGFALFTRGRDQKVRHDTSRLKSMEYQIFEITQLLQTYEDQQSIKALLTQLQELQEMIRFSDPITHESVHQQEVHIAEELLKVKQSVQISLNLEELETEISRLTTRIEALCRAVASRNEQLRLVK